jgi:RNA polymerase sigma factor (sigma-70 family)
VSTFSDASLIARVLVDDDRNAFGELVRRYQSQVRSLLMKLTAGNKPEADDLAQETFIRAYRHLKKFRGEASFPTWLYRIAYNQFISSKRQDGRFEPCDEIDEAAAPEPETVSGSVLARIDLQKVMVWLSPVERAALTLSYGYGIPHDEIAHLLECPLGTVKTHINRARAKVLKKYANLQPEEIV